MSGMWYYISKESLGKYFYLTNDDATYESPKKNNILENNDDETATFLVADSDSNHATYDHDNSKSESMILQENVLAYDDDNTTKLKADSKQDMMIVV
eukprot:scaffold26714_cov74-Attheya_sp.AAC.4